MGEKSCQPEGLQPERPLTLSRGLLIFAISAAPRFALSTAHLENSAATHTCFIVLQALNHDTLALRRSIRHCGLAHAGEWLAAHATVAANYERSGHRLVDLEVIIVADASRVVAQVRHTAIYRLRQEKAVSP